MEICMLQQELKTGQIFKLNNELTLWPVSKNSIGTSFSKNPILEIGDMILILESSELLNFSNKIRVLTEKGTGWVSLYADFQGV